MSTGWLTKSLADVCQIRPPKTEARQRVSGSDLVSFVPMEDLGVGQKIFVPTQTRPLDEVVGSYTYFADGDVLLAKITPCFENGKLGIADGLSNGVGFGSSEYFVFRPGSLIDKDWLYYFLSRESFKVEGAARMSGAVGHKRVAKEFVEGYQIPLPPVAEQRRIVAILDEAFEGIDTAVANAEKNLANARELFDSYLNSVFARKGNGWVEKRLSDICRIESKLVDPREASFIDLPHLGAGNMISKTGEIVEVKTAREEALISGKFLFNEDTVLYSKIRPYLMKACRPQFSGLCSADVYPLVADNAHMDRDFLFHMLMSRRFTDYAVSGSGRAGMPKVNRDHLFRYSVWLPLVEEQARLAAKLDLISAEAMRLETIYERKRTGLSKLKQTVLQKAFAGKLTGKSVEAVQEAAE